MSDNQVHSLGESLRQRREELGISLQKAEVETRIRAQYLRALEDQDYEALPNPVVARGFLRNYASYLGLDPQEAVGRSPALAAVQAGPSLAAGKTSPLAGDLMFRPVPLQGLAGQRSRRGLYLGLILLPLVALAALAWWYYPRVSAFVNELWPDRPAPTQTTGAVKPVVATLTPVPATTQAPGIAAASAEPTPLATLPPTRTSAPARSPTPTLTPSPPIYSGVFVELNFVDTSWVQITVDGVRQFQGELQAGARQSWYGEERVDLRIGNAGGVEVTVNGEKLGTLGAVGEVVDRSFVKLGSEADLTVTPGLTATLPITVAPTPAVTATNNP